MSDSFSKDFKDAIDDVAVSLHKGFKKIKDNKQVKDFTKNTVGAFENLGEQLDKGFNDLAGKKQTKTEVKKEDAKETSKEPVSSDENPIKENK